MKKPIIFFLLALLFITITISSCNTELNISSSQSTQIIEGNNNSVIPTISSENSNNTVSNEVSVATSDVSSETSKTVSEVSKTETSKTVSEPKAEVSTPVVIKYYNVTFDPDGGKLVSGKLSQQIENGKSATAPTVKKDGYTFVGWDKAITAFNKDTTIKAKWKLTVVENPASDFEIIELVDSIIIKQYIGTSPNVVIPAKIKNKPVTQLGLMCFDGISKIKSVVLPEGLEVIGAHVFQYSKLETIELPSTLKVIGVAAFADCENLKAITLPESLVEIMANAFMSTPSMENQKDEFFIKDGVLLKYNGTSTHVKVPSTVRLIAPYVFFDNRDNIKEITLPSSVKSISVFSIGGLPNLEKINFSEGLEYIAAGAISSCPELQPIKFPRSLKYIGRLSAGEGSYHPFKYEDQEFGIFGDGVLRAYNGTDTTITIPNNVKVLSFVDFIKKDTEKVIIPESVKVLESLNVPNSQWLYGWEPIIKLKEVYFPASIQKLGDDFYYTSIMRLESLKADKYVTFYVKKGSFMESVFKFHNMAYKYY